MRFYTNDVLSMNYFNDTVNMSCAETRVINNDLCETTTPYAGLIVSL